MRLMFHDDSCGELLDRDGRCPSCGLHPDMQSTGFRDVPEPEVRERQALGRTFLGEGRKPVG
jgi:hypothetical protein